MNKILLSFDTDWAPDFVIEKVTNILIQNKIKSTWFITHSSPLIDEMKKNIELFEIGLHPNFYQFSDHGSSEEQVLENIKKLCPEATSIRMHGLYQNTNLFTKITDILPNISIDVSLYLPQLKEIEVFDYYAPNMKKLKRIPYVWEDDMEFLNHQNWSIKRFKNNKGITILNFHPIHVFLNSSNYNNYNDVKKKYAKISKVPETFLKKFISKSEGARTMFDECVEYFKDYQSYKINEVT